MGMIEFRNQEQINQILDNDVRGKLDTLILEAFHR